MLSMQLRDAARARARTPRAEHAPPQSTRVQHTEPGKQPKHKGALRSVLGVLSARKGPRRAAPKCVSSARAWPARNA
eukprot:12476008-Alexandrium_andersonii.AAC.1